jgi:hypothetical protein
MKSSTNHRNSGHIIVKDVVHEGKVRISSGKRITRPKAGASGTPDRSHEISGSKIGFDSMTDGL